MPTPLNPTPLKPLNNHVLVEIERDYADVIRHDDNELVQKGKVLDISFTTNHLTAMAGWAIPGDPNVMLENLQYIVGKTVYWSEGAEAGAKFKFGEKTYALIPFYRLISYEETSPKPKKDTK